MAYRDILVRMDGAASQAGVAKFAADLAAKSGARLLGAFARSQLPQPYTSPDVIAALPAQEIQRIADAYERDVAAAGERAREAFESAASAEEVQSDWRVVEDSEGLTACARRTDLLVLSAEAGPLIGGLAPVPLIMAGGGPAILVPPGVAASTYRRVLVAWNGSGEASRALRAAWPILGMADEVDVLVVARGGLTGPDGLLQRHFEAHGVKLNLIEDDSDDASAGKVLRRQVDAREPDLVVMGLYGRTRIQELILGGVSRDMLAQPNVPLFVHH
ncbi:MAG: universal stress protein [Pseudomonadota bacterium]